MFGEIFRKYDYKEISLVYEIGNCILNCSVLTQVGTQYSTFLECGDY